MSIHKLTAGSGYDYLTRQVAVLDATDKGYVGLASYYYIERGESPGAWIGSGMAGIDGLNVGHAVTAEQMRALFGAGLHPLAAGRLEQLEDADLTDANLTAATQLGAPFKVYASEVSPFRIEVAKRIAARHGAAAEKVEDDPISTAIGARVRTEVAREFFRNEHGRDPIDAREIAATIAKGSRPRTQTVAGYDLTFSPGQVGVELVGGRRPTPSRTDRSGAPGCGAGCTGLHRTVCIVHPTGKKRDPPSQCHRHGSRGVHPPRLPGR
jgi:hypothetical protein